MPHLSEERKARIDAFALYVAVLPWFNIDVLHKLYINIFAPVYVPAANEKNTGSYELRAIACADLLQSSWVKRIDYNVFIFFPEKRDLLRNEMLARPQVMKQLGEFMLSYAATCRQHFLGMRYLEVYRIEGNLIVNPLAEADHIAQHIAHQLNRNSAPGNMQPSVAYYLNMLDRDDQKAGNETLRALLKGLDSYFKEDEEQAAREWEQMANQEPDQGASISIKLPKKVQRAILEQIGKLPTEEDKAPRSIYAVIVGINDYGRSAQSLNSSVNDALAIHRFLQELTAANKNLTAYYPSLLLAPNEADYAALQEHNLDTNAYSAPTRQNIIDTFQQFKAAGKEQEDICIFYFAGHSGFQQSAFREDPIDNTLICSDSRTPGGQDLTDKELSFLLWEALRKQGTDQEDQDREVHTVVILDSNISSRRVESNVGNYQQMSKSSYKLPSGTKSLPDYLGYRDALSLVKANNAEEAYLQAVEQWRINLPVITLSAGSDEIRGVFETQINGKDHGIFTYSLLQVLRKGGGLKLTYTDLMTSVQNLVRKKVENQVPQLSVTGSTDTANLTFLDGPYKNPETYYRVSFDAKQSRWVMQAGATNGIAASSEMSGRTVVRVWPVTDPDEFVDVEVVEVRTAQSYFAVEEGVDLDPSQEYMAEVMRMATPPIRLKPSQDMHPADRPKLLDEMSRPSLANFVITEDAERADYMICIQDGSYWLTRPGNDIPLFKPSEDFQEFEDHLQTLGRWKHLLDLSNPTSGIRREAIQVEVEVIEETPLSLEGMDSVSADRVLNDPEEIRVTDKGNLQPAIRIKLRSSGRRYFVSALFMDSLFGISANLEVEETALDKEVYLTFENQGSSHRTIPLHLDEQYSRLGISEITAYIKIFVSTHEHTVKSWEQRSLEMAPDEYLETSRSIGQRPKGILIEEDELYDADDWTSIIIPIHIKRLARPQLQAIGGDVPNELRIGQRTLTVPEGFSAKLTAWGEGSGVDQEMVEEMLAGTSEASRALREHVTYAQELAARFGEEGKERFALIELTDIRNADYLNPNTPIIIRNEERGSNLEVDLCYCFSPSGLYIPLAFSNNSGEIRLEMIPEASSGKLFDEESRPLKKASEQTVKLFLQRLQLSAGLERTTNSGLSALAIQADGNYELADIDPKRLQDPSARVCLMLPGFFESAVLHKDPIPKINRVLDRAFDIILFFHYDAVNTPLEKTAHLLKDQLERIGLRNERRLTILAEDIGGLLARWFTEQVGGDQFTERLIMLAPPNNGIIRENLHWSLLALLQLAMNGSGPHRSYLPALMRLNGEFHSGSISRLDKLIAYGSDFLKRLNEGGSYSSGYPGDYHLIAGNTDRAEAKELDKDLRTENYLHILREIRSNRIGDRPETPNDLLVSISDARNLPAKYEFYEVGCDHLSYYHSEQVAENLEYIFRSNQYQTTA